LIELLTSCTLARVLNHKVSLTPCSPNADVAKESVLMLMDSNLVIIGQEAYKAASSRGIQTESHAESSL